MPAARVDLGCDLVHAWWQRSFVVQVLAAARCCDCERVREVVRSRARINVDHTPAGVFGAQADVVIRVLIPPRFYLFRGTSCVFVCMFARRLLAVGPTREHGPASSGILQRGFFKTGD